MSKILLIIFLHTATGDKDVAIQAMPSITACQTQAQLIWDNNGNSGIDAYCHYIEEGKRNG